MKNIFIQTFFLLVITIVSGYAQFITTWKTDNAGTSQSDQIQLPIYGDGYEIYWWLKSDSTGVNGTAVASGDNFTLTLPQPGVYGISISKGNGTLNYFRFSNAGDKLKLLEINKWGNHTWTSMQEAFYGCSNLIISASDVPNFSLVKNLARMFRECSRIEQIPNIQNWDVSHVTVIEGMFAYASAFNQPLNHWDVSNVTDIIGMFNGASAFNQPLNDWDVRSVTDMRFMFNYSGIDCANITHTLQGWAANPLIANNITLGAIGINYAAEVSDALDMLRTQKGWTINLGSEVACERFDAFTTIWKTDDIGTSNVNQITLPVTGTNYKISWENEANPAINGTNIGNGSNYTLTFPGAGRYIVRISKGEGSLDYIRFNNAGDKLKLIQITNWGKNTWTSMENAFSGCRNLTISAIDRPNLTQVRDMSRMFRACGKIEQIPDMENWDVSNVTNMSYMFNGAILFNQSLSGWDVSNVTNMSSMFFVATSFNESLNGWDVSNVTSMGDMFAAATSFNQPLRGWDVSNVTYMSYMFFGATSFNQSLNNWIVSKVTNMSWMFSEATTFNESISGWDVSNVTNVGYMFYGASSFNQSLSGWDVSNVTDMRLMFCEATSFNQSLSEWNLSKVTNMGSMFNSTGIDCANITHTLQGWAANPLTPNNITLGAGRINYAAEANDALNTLRNDKGWSINIGSEVACQQLPVTLVHFKAVQQENGVRLDWATSLEQDHDYFEVQRSVDSKNWSPLTRIQGSGNGNALHDYAYVDKYPLQATSYYRLKMVDLDGTTAYSTIRSVNRGNVSTVKVYPNPASASVTLSGLPKGMLKIYNRLGVMVGQQYITPQETTFSVAKLPAGTYILKMEHGWQHQLVKVY